jgi:hypothetical protein
MSAGAWMMALVMLVTAGALVFLVYSTVKTVLIERTPGRSIWREFGLGLVLMFLFFSTWIAQGVAEWQTYTDEQAAHGESAELGNFVGQFTQSTLENWQSEFLQLFAFVTLAALYIHKGSAESKDSDDKMEASLRRIEEHLGTLPSDAPNEKAQKWQLPETPLQLQD